MFVLNVSPANYYGMHFAVPVHMLVMYYVLLQINVRSIRFSSYLHMAQRLGLCVVSGYNAEYGINSVLKLTEHLADGSISDKVYLYHMLPVFFLFP